MDELLCDESMSQLGNSSSGKSTVTRAIDAEVAAAYNPATTYDAKILCDSRLLSNLLVTQMQNRADPHYMLDSRTNITARMRAILVNWMLEVSHDLCIYALLCEVLHIVNYFCESYLLFMYLCYEL